MKNSIIKKLKTSELKRELSLLIELDLYNREFAPEKDPLTPMLWGSFGIGKTSITKELPKLLNFDDIITLRLNVLTPIDTKGVPSIQDIEFEITNEKGEIVMSKKKRTVFVEPSFVPTDPNKKYLIFFDEVNTAPPLTQSVAYEIAHERTIAGHKLPQKTCVIMAGNRAKDRGVTFDMPLPLANRCVHYEIESDFESWFDNCNNKGIEVHQDIATFLKMNKNYIHMELVPDYEVEEIPAVPSNRTWSMLNDYILFLEKKGITYTKEDVARFVGQKVATEYNNILIYKDRIPDLDQLLITGDLSLLKKMDSTDLSLKYFVTYSLYIKLIKKLFDDKNKLSEGANKIKENELFNNFLLICKTISEEDELTALIISLMKNSKYSLNFTVLIKETKNEEVLKKCTAIIKGFIE